MANSEKEDIPFDIVPAYKDSDKNVIKCLKSNVTIDFASEYTLVELNEKGNSKAGKNLLKTTNQILF